MEKWYEEFKQTIKLEKEMEANDDGMLVQPVEYHIYVETYFADNVAELYAAFLEAGMRTWGYKSITVDSINHLDTGFDIYYGETLEDVQEFVAVLKDIGVPRKAISVYDLVQNHQIEQMKHIEGS